MFSKELNLNDKFTKNAKTHLITFVNPVSFYGFLKHKKRYEFADVYSDGALLTKLHNLFFKDLKTKRISFDFSSIANAVLTFSEKNDKNITFIGGSSDESVTFEREIKKLYPLLKITCYSGYFSEKNSLSDTLVKMNHSPPDIIVCGMGYPRQEEFLVTCKENLNKPFLGLTCGGFISQTSMSSDYYHPIIKRLGLRWLQRAFMHHHVRKRLLKDYPIFLFRYLYDVITKGDKFYNPPS